MAQFIGDIAFIMELVVIASGLYLLGKTKKEDHVLIKTSGYLLTIGGAVIMVCTSFFYLKYYFQGEFETASFRPGVMQNMMMDDLMRRGNMGPGMMPRGGMGPGMMPDDTMRPGLMHQGEMGPGMMMQEQRGAR